MADKEEKNPSLGSEEKRLIEIISKLNKFIQRIKEDPQDKPPLGDSEIVEQLCVATEQITSAMIIIDSKFNQLDRLKIDVDKLFKSIEVLMKHTHTADGETCVKIKNL